MQTLRVCEFHYIPIRSICCLMSISKLLRLAETISSEKFLNHGTISLQLSQSMKSDHGLACLRLGAYYFIAMSWDKLPWNDGTCEGRWKQVSFCTRHMPNDSQSKSTFAASPSENMLKYDQPVKKPMMAVTWKAGPFVKKKHWVEESVKGEATRLNTNCTQ